MATLFPTPSAPATAPTRSAPLPPLLSATPKSPSPAAPGAASFSDPHRNVLAQDVRIQGQVCFVGVLIIDGQMEGEMQSEGTLLVGEHARLQGEITVREAIIHGRVEGTLRVTDRCELHASACLVGELTAGRLVLHEGATFLGKSQVAGAGRPLAIQT